MATLTKTAATRASASRRGFNISRWIDSPAPHIAVEIAPARVVAARRESRSPALGQVAIRPLAKGQVVPSATESNIRDRDAVAGAIRTALETIGGGREVILLVPDLTARVSLLDFDNVPGKLDELAALVRFRLRKTLPFDADTAALSVQVLPAEPKPRVLAIVAQRQHLDEYEDCLEAAGSRASIVLPAGLAMLTASPELEHGTLLVKSDGLSLTTAFVWRGVLAFYRVVDTDPAGSSLYEDLFPSIAFYRDFIESRLAQSNDLGLRIEVAGLPAETVERLRDESPWAEVVLVGSGAPLVAGQEPEAVLAAAGALVNSL